MREVVVEDSGELRARHSTVGAVELHLYGLPLAQVLVKRAAWPAMVAHKPVRRRVAAARVSHEGCDLRIAPAKGGRALERDGVILRVPCKTGPRADTTAP